MEVQIETIITNSEYAKWVWQHMGIFNIVTPIVTYLMVFYLFFMFTRDWEVWKVKGHE